MSSDWEGTATGFGGVFGTLKIVLVFSTAISAAPMKLCVGPSNACLALRGTGRVGLRLTLGWTDPFAAEKKRLVTEKKLQRPKALAPIGIDAVPVAVPEEWDWTRLGIAFDVPDGPHGAPPDLPGGATPRSGGGQCGWW